ncbi:tail fiber protein [Escherichia coli]|nr:phage tail protein [Escherichia coli]EHK7112447.1 tail fiber protein [Escherichia coli]EHK7135291.1 tail fiber protein [Escherichia coli]EHK7150548.1 tail fiber protein [Escherichia coli]
MNDVTVVTSVTYPSPESLALVADVQYHEPYLSAALNRKFRGIVAAGFYAGFLPKPGGGMNLLITSVDGDKTAGAASVDIGEFYQVTIQQRKDISLALSAGKKYAIVLKGRYLLGEDTCQVNTASHIYAAEFIARTYTDSYQLGDGELLVCTVNVPVGVSAVTQEMIDTSDRINRSLGIGISDSVTSSRSDIAASSRAVKKAYDLAKSKYTAQDASTTQTGLVQLSSATDSDSETMAATPKAVKSVKDLADTKATIESPSLTGTPTAPTAVQGTNSAQIATTAYVMTAISALVGSSPEALDTLNELASALGNDPNFATTITNMIGQKVDKAGDIMTGKLTLPQTSAFGINVKNTIGDNSLAIGDGNTGIKYSEGGVLDVFAKGILVLRFMQGKVHSQKEMQIGEAHYSTTGDIFGSQWGNKWLSTYLEDRLSLVSSHTHEWRDIKNVPTASTSRQGIVQLSSSTNSTSELMAATAKAVKEVYDLANGKQPKDATLSALAGLVTGDNKLPYFTGTDTAALTTLSAVGRAIIGKSTVIDVLNYLGLGEGSVLPVGVPVPWPSEIPPTGWLKCNGADFSPIQYPELAKVYPKNKLPDLRGEFIRGWDNGRGVDSGRTILSQQYGNTPVETYEYPVGTGYSVDIRAVGIDDSNKETRPRNISFLYIVRAK